MTFPVNLLLGKFISHESIYVSVYLKVLSYSVDLEHPIRVLFKHYVVKQKFVLDIGSRTGNHIGSSSSQSYEASTSVNYDSLVGLTSRLLILTTLEL